MEISGEKKKTSEEPKQAVFLRGQWRTNIEAFGGHRGYRLEKHVYETGIQGKPYLLAYGMDGFRAKDTLWELSLLLILGFPRETTVSLP